MYEFITALFMYSCVLLGIFSYKTDINLLTDNIQFTATVTKENAAPISYSGCSTRRTLLPMTKLAEVCSDTVAYSDLSLSGTTVELDESEFVNVIGISNDGGIYVISVDGIQWYIASRYLRLESDDVLGTPISLVVPDDKIPSMFVANTEDCNIKQAYGLYRLMPQYIQDAIEENGWVIEVTNEDLQDKFKRDNPVAGITIHTDKRIYLKNEPIIIKYSLYHEVAHALDKSLGYPSNTEEWVEIFEEEKDNFHAVGMFVNNYHQSNPCEYWASAVNNILMTADKYEDSAPRTYEYVRRYLCRMKKNTR